jgi:hypothetical protein
MLPWWHLLLALSLCLIALGGCFFSVDGVLASFFGYMAPIYCVCVFCIFCDRLPLGLRRQLPDWLVPREVRSSGGAAVEPSDRPSDHATIGVGVGEESAGHTEMT